MFDLNSLALKETTEVPLTHPVTNLPLGEEGKEVVIHLYGTSSKRYRDAVHAMQQRALSRGKKQPTPEQLKNESITLLVECSDKIDNLVFNGKPVDNPATFRELYSDAKFEWLKQQVDAALAETSNFLAQ